MNQKPKNKEPYFDWSIDIKVFCTIAEHEIVSRMPAYLTKYKNDYAQSLNADGFMQVQQHATIPKGYHTLILKATEDELDNWHVWCNKQTDIKVIGISKI